jgi:hypothetical protein
MSAAPYAMCTRCQEPDSPDGIPECICPRLWPVPTGDVEQLALPIDVPLVQAHDVDALLARCRRLLEEDVDDIPHLYRGRPVLTVITGGGLL